jgi:hypothetical protein
VEETVLTKNASVETIIETAKERAESAREALAPTLEVAKERAHAIEEQLRPVLIGAATTAKAKGNELRPVIASAASTARTKGSEFLASDPAQEALRRGTAMLAAAKGETLVATAKKARRWPIALTFFGIGTAAGIAAAVVSKRMSTPIPPVIDNTPTPREPDESGLVDLTDVNDPVVDGRLPGGSTGGSTP